MYTARRLALFLVLAGVTQAWAQPVPLPEDVPEPKAKPSQPVLGEEARAALVAKVVTLSRRCTVLYDQQRFDEALPLAEEVLALHRRLYPKERFPLGHVELATGLSNLGSVCRARQDWARAEALLREALAMNRALFPAARFSNGHPDLAASLYDLGGLRHECGDLEGAEPLLREALAMFRKLYPPARFPDGHPNVALSLSYLGGLCQSRGDLDEAETLHRQALAMRRRLYPAERYAGGHPHLVGSLGNLGLLLCNRGDTAAAEPLLREALAMSAKVYPAERFPAGHPHRAKCLGNLGRLLQDQGDLAGAEGCCRQALAMYQKLYPPQRCPAGHPNLAHGLNSLGTVLQVRGDLAEAERSYRAALAMYRKLYPAERFPGGQPDLALSLHNLGTLLWTRGEPARAETYAREALAMYRKLYPAERYPHGHPDLARNLSALGLALQARGNLARAESVLREALAMYRQVYRPERFPAGHAQLAFCLQNLGILLKERDDLAGAEPLYREALAMCRKLYPPARFPAGHADLAKSLSNLGVLLHARGDLAGAQAVHREALAMRRRLYPADHFPAGHAELANSLGNLGGVLRASGDLAAAEPYYQEALAMQQRLADVVLAGAAEAEAFNYLASLPGTRSGYLSVTGGLPARDDASYAAVWNGKAMVARLLERRRQALVLTADPATRDLGRQLQEARRDLARLLLAPALTPEQARRVQALSDHKEELERQLARQLPAFAALEARRRLRPADLLKQLPEDAVFVDVLHYLRFEQDPDRPGRQGERYRRCYVAFLLARGQEARRVELGPAEPIEAGAAAWWRALVAGERSPKLEALGAALGRLVWAPLAKHLPTGVRTVYLAPDGALAQLPWAALPGGKAGTVLLEDYALAIVPHGPFLLEALASRERPPPEQGTLLAVGDVAYDRPARAVALGQGEERSARPARVDGAKLSWPALPGAARELEGVLHLAGKRPTLVRRGAEASTAQLLVDLPKARWAHLATHGFFAGARFRSALGLREQDYAHGWLGERVGSGARSPLVLSGLVLAGANLPVQDLEKEDGGILTAEAIAGLNLDGLDLAVLSACETGLAEVAGGEGVFGLQRTFHIAGTRNVIASLWQVDDEATAALMSWFYHHLWVEKRSPLEALRQAQLALYHHPERIGPLARARGPDFEKAARLPATPQAAGRAPARLWAGFVLSGAGQ
jgi:CHAT domain-containing protein/Flp pilus assembly protein TadD